MNEVTFNQIRQKVQLLVADGKRQQVVEILKSFGVNVVAHLGHTKYPEFLQKLEAIALSKKEPGIS